MQSGTSASRRLVNIGNRCSDDTCAAFCMHNSSAAVDGEESAELCQHAACDAEFNRCWCTGDTVRRMDGACLGAPRPGSLALPSCQASHSALFFLASAYGPEIRKEQIAVGNISRSLSVLVWRAVAAALNTTEVLVSDLQLARQEAMAGMSGGGLITLDLAFAFCAEPEVAELDPAKFEVAYRTESQRYTIFDRRGTVRLVNLRDIRLPSAGTEAPAVPTRLPDGGARLRGQQGASDQGPLLVGIMCIVGVVMVFGILAAAWSLWRRRHRLKVAAEEEARREAEEEGEGESGNHAPKTFRRRLATPGALTGVMGV